MADVPTFLARKGIGIGDLIALLRTSFVNPHYPTGPDREFFAAIPLDYSALMTLVCDLIESLLAAQGQDQSGGIEGLLNLGNQNLSSGFDFQKLYAPDTHLVTEYPSETIDFSPPARTPITTGSCSSTLRCWSH